MKRFRLRLTTAGEERGWRARARRLLKAVGAGVTFAIACYGAYTAWSNEQRAKEIEVELTVSHGAPAPDRVFEVGIVNNSQRAVSVVSGAVRFDGAKVGELSRFVRGRPSVDPRREAERLAGASSPPFGLAGGQSFSGTVEWRLPEEGYAPAIVDEADAYLSQERVGGNPGTGRMVLELRLEPEGEVKAPVRLTLGDFDDRRPPGHAPGWYSFLRLDNDFRVTGVGVNTTGEGPALATFELWGRRAAPLLTVRRPVTSSMLTTFALPRRLRPGTYDWAVSVGGEAVALGRFVTPCPKESLTGSGKADPEECRPEG